MGLNLKQAHTQNYVCFLVNQDILESKKRQIRNIYTFRQGSFWWFEMQHYNPRWRHRKTGDPIPWGCREHFQIGHSKASDETIPWAQLSTTTACHDIIYAVLCGFNKKTFNIMMISLWLNLKAMKQKYDFPNSAFEANRMAESTPISYFLIMVFFAWVFYLIRGELRWHLLSCGCLPCEALLHHTLTHDL